MFGHKERRTPLVREPITSLEDIRDDCVALFQQSKLTREEVHRRGGPTSATIGKWLYKETHFPRLDSIRGLLQALGHDLAIVKREK